MKIIQLYENTDLINQRCNYSCAIACVSMFAGLKYEDVEEAALNLEYDADRKEGPYVRNIQGCNPWSLAQSLGVNIGWVERADFLMKHKENLPCIARLNNKGWLNKEIDQLHVVLINFDERDNLVILDPKTHGREITKENYFRYFTACWKYIGPL